MNKKWIFLGFFILSLLMGSFALLPGFFMGIWQGLIAPYTLFIRLFIDIHMYSCPNSGWFYDLGFLMGIAGSLPMGWFIAIITIILLLFGVI